MFIRKGAVVIKLAGGTCLNKFRHNKVKVIRKRLIFIVIRSLFISIFIVT